MSNSNSIVRYILLPLLSEKPLKPAIFETQCSQISDQYLAVIACRYKIKSVQITIKD